MAEYQLAEERIISGKGVLKVPVDKDTFRHAYLLLDVIREPRSPYKNFNWNPPQSKYAFLVFRRNEYVVDSAYMEFDRQLYDTVPDITSQNLIAIKCAYDGILTSFEVLSAALGLTVLPRLDLIKDYDSLSLQWDEVLIKCYADTALQARLYYIDDDSCTPDRRDREPVPDFPAPLPKVPSGTSIGDISPAYDEENDDGNTEPYEGDEIPEPPLEPPGVACQKYVVVVRVYTNFSPDPDFRDFTMYAYGEVLGVRKNSFQGQTAAVIDCQGLFQPTDENCQPSVVARTVYNGINSFDPDPEIISFSLFEE